MKGYNINKHLCRTYFKIIGNFQAQVILEQLNLPPCKVINKGDPLPNKKRASNFDAIIIGVNDQYSVDINEMIRVTIKELIHKINLLSELKAKYNLTYYLEIVPTIASDSKDPTPILSLDDDIIEFLFLTKAKHDLDYYIS